MSVVMYHNPRCSKSRQTLTLLQEQGIEPTIIEYLKNPPSSEQLNHILKQLGLSARELIRKNESEYKSQGLDNPSLSEDELIAAMVATPILIERPIVISGKRAAIGRPPEAVLTIL